MKTNDMFSYRDNMQDAVTYAQTLISALPSESQLPALTAMWIVANTAIRTSPLLADLPFKVLTKEERAARPKLSEIPRDQARQFLRNNLAAAMLGVVTLRDDNHPTYGVIGETLALLCQSEGLTPQMLAEEKQAYMEAAMASILKDPEAIIDLLAALRKSN